MAKPGGGGKLILGAVIILIITVVLIGVTLRFYQEATEERTQVLILTLTISDGEEDLRFIRLDPDTSTYLPFVKNISSDASIRQYEMSILDAPKEDAALANEFPIIWVYKVANTEGTDVGYRNSIKYTGPETYELIISLDGEPEPGDVINLYFKIVDQRLVMDQYGNTDITDFQMFPYFDNDFDVPNSRITYVWE